MKSEAIDEEAARWFCRRDSGAWTDADQEAFDAWLASSLAHRIAYIRIAAAWRQAARMKALGAGVPRGTIPPRGSWGDTRFSISPSKKSSETVPGVGPRGIERADRGPTSQPTVENGRWKLRSRRLRVAAIAASVLFTVVYALYFDVTDTFAGDQFSTPVGGMKTIRLADGSRVTLNTDTRIRVRLGGKERHVDLIRGEAFFKVSKDAAHPFVVRVGDERVMAVGTAFSVRRDSGDIEVVVTEGKVQLANAPSLLAALEEKSQSLSGLSGSRARDSTPPVTWLGAGSIARTANGDIIVQEQSVPEAEELLSWRSGYIVFRDTSLEQVVAEFNRYNSRKIVIDDAAIGALRVGGNFHSGNTEAFLALLQSGFQVRVEESSDRVVLRAAR